MKTRGERSRARSLVEATRDPAAYYGKRGGQSLYPTPIYRDNLLRNNYKSCLLILRAKIIKHLPHILIACLRKCILYTCMLRARILFSPTYLWICHLREFYLFVNYFVIQAFYAYHINTSRWFNLILTGMTLRSSLLKRVTCFISQFICNNILSCLDGTCIIECKNGFSRPYRRYYPSVAFSELD